MNYYNSLFVLLLCIVASAASAKSLFFSKSDEQQLRASYERWLNPPPAPVYDEPVYVPPPIIEPPKSAVKLDGFIVFEGADTQKGSAWLDGTQVDAQKRGNNVRVKTPSGYKVLKPGQQFDPNTGKIIEPAAQRP